MFGAALISLCIIHLLAVMSPGPDFIVVTRLALTAGTSYGLLAAFGITLANAVVLLAAIMGTSALAEQSPHIMNAIQFVGALYLGYIGLRCLRTSPPNTEGDEKIARAPGAQSYFKAFQDGFFTSLLNSKAIIYFLSIASQFSSPASDTGTKMGGITGLLLITLVWFAFVSVVAGLPALRSRLHNRQHIIDRVMGTVLIAYCAVILIKLF